ncbi:MAG TPA: type III polyketide synthase [Candidatus Dormibacteraeota bacterium]|nr:type III polyketide synthase [Candidatus Dormibacteraeota bacterium]
MTRFAGLGTALPVNELTPAASLAALSQIWPHLRSAPLEAVTRYTVQPVDQVFAPRSLGERMAVYEEEAPRLAQLAVEQALSQAGLAPDQIDVVFSVSCTGYMVPALDVRLANRLGFRGDVIRIPLTELGCSGGAAAIAAAHRHLCLEPTHNVLVVCVELCSLTFQPGDSSVDNMTAAMVFGDGAAAAVLTGEPGGLEVVATGCRLIPDTDKLLGFDLRDDGFHPVLDRRLPRLIEHELAGALAGFGEGHFDFVAVHAGGPRIFDAVESGLGLSPRSLEPSRATFSRFGNLSSASLLFVLAGLHKGPPGMGLGLAFGPGVTVEMATLRRSPE